MGRLRMLGGAVMDTHCLASSDRQQQLTEITTTDADGSATMQTRSDCSLRAV